MNREHRRGGVLKALLIVFVILALAGLAVFLIATRGAKMQEGLRNTGDKLRDKVTGQGEEPQPPAQPQPPTAERPPDAPVRPPPPAVRTTPKPPPDETKPVYTVKRPPPVQKTWHTVAKGETLYTIAETYYEDGKLWKLIADANGLKDRSDVKEGMLIVIPGR
jgi:nucleoid-associated protein YgaU